MNLTLIETSPVLKEAQKEALSEHNPVWCSELDQIPSDKPIIVIVGMSSLTRYLCAS